MHLNKVYLSPAKINLFFCVLGKYNKGFHEVYSVMTALDFYDTLELKCSYKDSFKCNINEICNDSSNLVIRALNLFRKETQFEYCVDIELTKRIPLGSGLGGGSSNAATTLWALNELFNFPLTTSQLQNLAEKLGSDVPFFFSSGFALVTNKGGKLRNLDSTIKEPIVLYLSSDINASTQAVFAQLSQYSDKAKAIGLLQMVTEGLIVQNNDLLRPALQLYPKLRNRYEVLCKNGYNPHLSGSGSTLFSFCKKTLLPLEPGLECVSAHPIKRLVSSWY